MRRLAVGLVCLVLAACSSDDAGDNSAAVDSSEAVTNDTVRPDVSAEDCDDPDAALTQAEWVEFCAEESEETTGSGIEISPRGNGVAAVGEEVPIAAEGDAVTATITIDEITVDAPCPADTDAMPENGHFVRLDVRATTAPAGPPDPTDISGTEVRFSENVLSFIGPDGLTFNGSLGTFSAFGCLPDAEQLPETLGPGQRFAGAVMVDVPAPTGTLIYTDSATGQGWEWSF